MLKIIPFTIVVIVLVTVIGVTVITVTVNDVIVIVVRLPNVVRLSNVVRLPHGMCFIIVYWLLLMMMISIVILMIISSIVLIIIIVIGIIKVIIIVIVIPPINVSITYQPILLLSPFLLINISPLLLITLPSLLLINSLPSSLPHHQHHHFRVLLCLLLGLPWLLRELLKEVMLGLLELLVGKVTIGGELVIVVMEEHSFLNLTVLPGCLPHVRLVLPLIHHALVVLLRHLKHHPLPMVPIVVVLLHRLPTRHPHE